MFYLREVYDFHTRSMLCALCGLCAVFGLSEQVVLPPTYLERCYALVRAAGGVCIADEVQTGFGRNGDHFWMFQQHDVVSISP